MNLKTLALSLCLLFAFGCAANKYVVHPGAANMADSVAYDSVRDAQAIIDLARPQFDSGTLPATLKPLFNGLIRSYDIAAPLWKTYHAAALLSGTADATALNQALVDLTAALAAYKKGN